MPADWINAGSATTSDWEGAGAEQLRLVNEALARDLGMNLSAFLRASVAVSYTGAAKTPYGEFANDEDRSCFACVLTRPNEHKLVMRVDYAVLFPMIGIALGAKTGTFASPQRKPTDVELLVVTLLYRLVLSETFRAWAPLTETQLESVTVEVEQTPARALPAVDLMSATSFEITVGECTGQVVIAAPLHLFAQMLGSQEAAPGPKPDLNRSSAQILELMLRAEVTLDIWLDESEIRLADLLQLELGQIVKLDHGAEQKVSCTWNGQPGFQGQVVSTGSRRGFLIEDSSNPAN